MRARNASRIVCDDELEPAGQCADMPIVMRPGVFYVGSIDDSAARSFCAGLMDMSIVDSRDASMPIVIYINSPGGDIFSLMAMISLIDSVPNQVVTVALGKCFSAGAVLLSHGDVRFAAEHTRLMIHETSAWPDGGHIDDIRNMTDETSTLNDGVMELFAKNCGVKGGYKSLKRLFAKKRDIYMTPAEAIKFGLVDQIGLPRAVQVGEWKIVV